jgi:hypothetical protein
MQTATRTRSPTYLLVYYSLIYTVFRIIMREASFINAVYMYRTISI